MTLSRRALSILTVVVLLVLLGGGIWWRLRPADEGQDAADDGPTAADTAGVDVAAATQNFSTEVPQPVEGAEVVRDTLWISVQASGRAEAPRRTRVTARVEGPVVALPVRENQRVGEGETLVQLDTTELALELAQARSEYRRAVADYESRLLFDEEIEDPEIRRQREQFARAESGLDAAEVSLRQAELQLERATITAPFAGRVADVDVVEGDYLTAGTEVMSVVALDPIRIEVGVLEAQLPVLTEGRRATVELAAFPGETFTGRIASINPVVDPETRTGRVTVLVDNPAGRIKPGMYADAMLEARAFPDRVLVPRSAILERGEGRRRTMLFVYEEEGERGLAKWRYVTTGRENEELVEIVPSDEGMVEPGEVVLVDGHHYLAHDTRVRLVENVVVEGGRPGR